MYYEKCEQNIMCAHPDFIIKLVNIQKLCKKLYPNESLNKTSCNKCNIKLFYVLGNITWTNVLKHKIIDHKYYPSEYFIKIITYTVIYNNKIINPPIQIPKKYIKDFTYVSLTHNKLLIIDALMKRGSYPHYKLTDKNNKNKFIYSEHSGTISVKDGIIDNIIVSAQTDRIDPSDNSIFLPINTDIFKKYDYIFHTHPNTITYAGRLKDGIIYEFPSANDIYNFVKYYNEGNAQASLIITPEGTYVIRPIKYKSTIEIDTGLFSYLQDYIIDLEKDAIKKFKPYLKNLSNQDVFHNIVSQDFTFIDKYNDVLEPLNLYIEFYPRIKINNIWSLAEINLAYI